MFGTALGLLSQPDLHETAVHLDSGGPAVPVYRRADRRAPRHGLFGETRAADVLTDLAHPTPEAAVAAAARSFRGPLGDDLAIMSLQVP